MSVLSTLSGAAIILSSGFSPAAGAAVVTALDTAPAPDEVLQGTASVESVLEAVRPRASRRQIVGPFRVVIDGEALPLDRRSLGVKISASMDGRSASFALPVRSDALAPGDPWLEPLGTAADSLGAPPGSRAAVSISVSIFDGAAVRDFPLLTGGSIHGGRVSRARGAATRDVTVVGRKARYDKRKATLHLSPGHGLQRRAVVARLLAAGEIPAQLVGGGGEKRVRKEVSAIDALALGLSDQMLSAASERLYEDAAGNLRIGRLDEAPVSVAWSFAPRDILEALGQIGQEEVSDGPTSVIVNGSKQITRDSADGSRIEEQEVESWSTDPPLRAAWKQATDGTLSAVTPLAPPTPGTLYLHEVVTYRREFRGDTLISERTIIRSLANPNVARYRLDGTPEGGIDQYLNCYLLDPAALPGDGNLAYSWIEQRLVVTSDETVRHDFDLRGFRVRETTEAQGVLLWRASIKSRSTADVPWEDTNSTALREVLGSGDGARGSAGDEAPADYWAGSGPSSGFHQFDGEPFGFPPLLGRSVTEFTVSDDGFITKQVKTDSGWVPRPGSLELYHDGYQSRDESLVFTATLLTLTDYLPGTEGAATKQIVRTRDYAGRETKVSSYLSGHLPAATRSLDMIDPAWAEEFADDELEHTLAASRYEQQAFKVRASSDALLAVREAWEDSVDNDWLEDEEEAGELARVHLRKSAAFTRSWPILLNPLVEPFTKVHVVFPELGWDDDVWVTAVDHVETRSGGYTQVSGEVWPL